MALDTAGTPLKSKKELEQRNADAEQALRALGSGLASVRDAAYGIHGPEGSETNPADITPDVAPPAPTPGAGFEDVKAGSSSVEAAPSAPPNQARTFHAPVMDILARTKPSTGDDISAPVDLSDHAKSPLESTPAPQGPQRDTELEAAMKESALRHRIGSVFQMFGIAPAGMDQPVEQLTQQRQLQREHMQDVIQGEMHDPNSRPSKMLQALAVKKFGWSPKDAGGLVAADFPMVKEGYSADQVRAAREDRIKEDRYKADLAQQSAREKLAAEERMNKERMDERRFEAGQRHLDRQADKNNRVSDRVTIQTQGAKEMLEAADEMERVADDIGYGDAAMRGGRANRDYGLAVTKAGQAEAKAVHGGPSETASKEFEKQYYSPFDPRAHPDRIREQAAELRRRGIERGKSVNAAFEHQGKIVPVPPDVLQPKGGGSKPPERRVDVIMADGTHASLPASQVDAARRAGAIK